MAGIEHRFIRSRDDFFLVLAECLHRAREFERKAHGDPLLTNIRQQLEAVEQWTVDGRPPTKEERKKIVFARQVARELEPPQPPKVAEWGDRLMELAFYFKHWKSDEEWNHLDHDDFKVFFPDAYAK